MIHIFTCKAQVDFNWEDIPNDPGHFYRQRGVLLNIYKDPYYSRIDTLFDGGYHYPYKEYIHHKKIRPKEVRYLDISLVDTLLPSSKVLFPHVKGIKFDMGFNHDAEIIQKVGLYQYKNLREVIIDGANIDTLYFEHFNPNIRILKIQKHQPYSALKHVSPQISRLKKLKRLELDAADMKGEDITDLLITLAKMKNMRVLIIDNAPFGYYSFLINDMKHIRQIIITPRKKE